MQELDPEVRVVVLRGAGDKAFCTGGDAQESTEGGYDREMDYWHMRNHHLLRALTKPVIAAVNGWAVGGGHILHIICDLSIAADTAKFGQAARGSGALTQGSEPRIWHGLWERKKPGKCGSYAGHIPHRKHWRWVW